MLEQLSDLVVDFAEKVDAMLGEHFLPSYERGKALVEDSSAGQIAGRLLMFGVAAVGSVVFLAYTVALCLVGAAARAFNRG